MKTKAYYGPFNQSRPVVAAIFKHMPHNVFLHTCGNMV